MKYLQILLVRNKTKQKSGFWFGGFVKVRVIISKFKSSPNKPRFKAAYCRPEMQIIQLKFELSENRYDNNNRCYGFRFLFKSKLLKSPSVCTYIFPSSTFLPLRSFIVENSNSSVLYVLFWICGPEDLFDGRLTNKLVANLPVTASSPQPRKRKLPNLIRFPTQYEPLKLIKIFIDTNHDSSISKWSITI